VAQCIISTYPVLTSHCYFSLQISPNLFAEMREPKCTKFAKDRTIIATRQLDRFVFHLP